MSEIFLTKSDVITSEWNIYLVAAFTKKSKYNEAGIVDWGGSVGEYIGC